MYCGIRSGPDSDGTTAARSRSLLDVTTLLVRR
jgi:hypothetical protein